jgi:hypothetical protein
MSALEGKTVAIEVYPQSFQKSGCLTESTVRVADLKALILSVLKKQAVSLKNQLSHRQFSKSGMLSRLPND